MWFSVLCAQAAPNPVWADTIDQDLPNDRDGFEIPLTPEAPVQTEIINGRSATRDDWPMAGGMLMSAKINAFGTRIDQLALMCTSTLIAPDVVLLAAHCVDIDPLIAQLDPSGQAQLEDVEFYWSRRVDLSGYQLGGSAGELPADAIAVRDHIFHDDWDFASLRTGLARNNDVALLFLDEPVLDVEPAYLLAPGEADPVVDGAPVTVVGWGQQIATQQGQQPPPNSYGLKQQGRSHVAEVGRFEFKVGQVQSDVRKCHGDSGGPSFMEIDTDSSEVVRIVGITSHAYDNTDCFITGGVDTRVSAFYGWIDREMRQRCRAGTRAWCEEWGVLTPPAADGMVVWEDREVPKRGLGCNTSTGPFVLWGLLPLLLLRRRGS